jgi:uncharacterized protein YegL
LATLFQTAAPAAQADVLRANLLTRDLGDPREPGNAKLVMTLPASSEHLIASAHAEDFIVHIYPEDLSENEGMADRYRAGGLYLWRYKARLFLDVREVPRQDREGGVKVKVAFAPGGKERASGMAEGECRYASDLVDVVLAVDVSRSMNYNDPRKRRVAAARTFLEMAREGGGIGRVGLVTFNHLGNVETPLVSLEESTRLLNDLNKVGADGLTNLDIPLDLADRMLKESGSRRPVVVLLTDGKNEGTRYQNSHRRLAADGIRIFTVGLTQSADHKLLEEMADASDGMYFRAPSDSDLPEIYARLAAELGKRRLLRGEALSSPAGEGSIPVDATVRRLVAIADGGARVSLVDPLGVEVAGGGSGRIGGVYVGRPKAGAWNYSWSSAEAGVSALAFFGDTPFFLDLFPPQYQGDRMALGATLARGAAPFPAGAVWLEPLPGVPGGRSALFDDGLHDDGRAGDGVYATAVDLPPGYRDRFDVTLRAEGTIPEDGGFVRQAGGIAVRMPLEPEPEIKRFSLGGEDIDFGVLFPGETGFADARVIYEGRTPENFLFDLSWPDSPSELPSLFSRIDLSPGDQVFELEIAVPKSAVPGRYRGLLDVRADSGLGDARPAGLVVGEVSFTDPGAVDLGFLRPGEELDYDIVVPYHSGKQTPLEITASGHDLLAVAADRDSLGAGAGELRLTITASAPVDARDGGRSARIVLRAGPGTLEIPVRWRVLAFRGAGIVGGDVDFGVLFPGESGTAGIEVDLDSTRSEMLSFDLSWPETAGSLPGFALRQAVGPGRQPFTLDITVSRDAPPGPHRGNFSIRAENGLGDRRDARIMVGAVAFGDPGPIAIGEVKPGESAGRVASIPYRADKEVAFVASYQGDDGVTIAADAATLAAGEGTLSLHVAASPGANDRDGERSGRIALTAGPARLDLPVAWTVRGFRGALLGGDLDFGVVFPGETGTAGVTIDLDSTRSEELFFNLSWPGHERSFPAMAADEMLPPGRQTFELDLQAADNVRPGDYAGRFSIRAWNGLGDEREARVKVGAVTFEAVDPVDLGAIRPGTSAEKAIRIRYHADKAAPLAVTAEGMELSAFTTGDNVKQGDGEVEITVVAAIEPDALDGIREGVAKIHAGPGVVAIPVRWSVRSFWGAALVDDVDFGVIFPGETGNASIDILLDSTRSEAFDFSLTWPDSGGELPELSTRATILPGRQPYELEFTVPADARPIAHAGRFEIASERGLGDIRAARLIVGAVEFVDPGAVSFGAIKPGESATKRLTVSYRADKPATLAVVTEDGGALTASPGAATLESGEGRFDLDVSVTLPADADDRPAAGKVILEAGPGRLEIPVYWNIRGFQGAALGGDLDFGILFPGETGTALLSVLLDSTRPEQLSVNLRWPRDALPGYEASPMAAPGSTTVEVELSIPPDARPASLQGRISISAGNGLGDERSARVVIGSMLLGDPGFVHLGVMRPGETLEKILPLPYKTDKAASAIHSYRGDDGFSATFPRLLDAGEGEAELVFRVIEPADAADGERAGILTVQAGAAKRDIPVGWTVLGFRGAGLDGDIDFGVVFPGETTRVEAPLLLDSTRPETLYLDLSWPEGAAFLPSARFDQRVPPGRQTLELVLPIPADAPLGQYEGRFDIRSGEGGPADSRPARIRIGTVRFTDIGALDMGDVPPGTFVSKKAIVPYHADRNIKLDLAVSGDPALTAESMLDLLSAGDGDVLIEVVVSVPIGSADGLREGVATLSAGPGAIEIPVVWNVRAYAAPRTDGGVRRGPEVPFTIPDPERFAPVLPDPRTGSYRPEAYIPNDDPMPPGEIGDSPLDRTRRTIDDAFRRARDEGSPARSGDRPSGVPSMPGFGDDGRIGDAGEGGGRGPWNAWWIYLLAALLLLLLLLLLIAYLLYKMRKKALLLLASFIANLILLAIFIALLSSSVFNGEERRTPFEVNLVEMDDPARYGLTPNLENLVPSSAEALEEPRDSAGGAGAGSTDSLLAELADAVAASGASASPLDRAEALPGEAEATGELAALGAPSAAAVALEKTAASPRRRERRAEREARGMPQGAIPELAEPPPSEPANVADANAAAQAVEVVSERVNVDELVDPGATAWSDDARGPEIRSGVTTRLSAESMEMEFIARDPAVTAIETRGRRRNRAQAPSLVMEPMVPIDDPVRVETRQFVDKDVAREPLEPDFGVEEMRMDAAAGMPNLAHKAAGPTLPAGSSELAADYSARVIEGVREATLEIDRSSRRERQTNRESGGGPPVRPPSALTADASGAGRRPARSAGASTLSPGESRFDAGPGGMGDALEGAATPGGDRLGVELADAGRPGSLSGADDNDRVSGRTGTTASDGRSGGASEPGSRGGRGRRGGHPGDGPGQRDFGDRDRGGDGATGPGGAGEGGSQPGSGGDGRSGDGRGRGVGRGFGSGDREGRMDDLGPYGGGESIDPAALWAVDRPASRLDVAGDDSIIRFPSPGKADMDWERGEMRQRRRRGVAASSSVDPDALLVVVGDFSALSDDAPRNLFSVLARRLAPNVDVEERVLRPGDPTLGDCLLATLDPGDVENWTEAELRDVAEYLGNDGHIWLDSSRRSDNERALKLLADATGGERTALPGGHQLADAGPVDGVFVGGGLGVVATTFGWRDDWRYNANGDNGGREALRFLVRTLNLFLSGDADAGLSVGVAESEGGLAILGTPREIPEMVIGVGAGVKVWEDHSSGVAAWRLPSWSDKADLSVVSDGRGGRALRLDLGAAERGRVSVYRTLSPPEDFRSVDSLALDVYYGGGDGEAALSAVITAPEDGQWVDFESRPRALSRGWNRIEIRPAGDRFRSALTGWRGYDASPSALDRLGRLGIILYRNEKSAEVLLLGQIDRYGQ